MPVLPIKGILGEAERTKLEPTRSRKGIRNRVHGAPVWKPTHGKEGDVTPRCRGCSLSAGLARAAVVVALSALTSALMMLLERPAPRIGWMHWGHE